VTGGSARGVCNGDSGGPLLVTVGNCERREARVLSTLAKGCTGGGFYTNVASGANHDWLYQQIPDLDNPQPEPGRFDPTIPPLPSFVYAVQADGSLLCYRHDGYLSGAGANDGAWQYGNAVGRGWQDFKQVFSVSGAIYAITQDGQLLWYRHNGFNNCAGLSVPGSWDGSATVGTDCQNFAAVIPMTTSSGSGGYIYAITTTGDLLEYQNTGYSNGTPFWRGPFTVGTGWNSFKSVFAGGDGVLYGIKADGTLMWYRHEGMVDGTFRWSGPRVVGTGWQYFTKVFSTADGVIYAIQDDGTLLWYRHLGITDGTFRWAGPNVVGTGWQNFQSVFLRSPAPASPVN
jgi:hypothetical protein